MADPRGDQRLAAIVAADVAGYSRLMEADERATVATLEDCRAVFRGQVAAHGGRIVDTAGDSVLAVFPSAISAVEAAIEVQVTLHGRNQALPEQQRMHFRIGVNLGDVIEKDDGSIYGSGVNIAARLEGLAEPGGTMISEDVQRQIVGKMDRRFQDAGVHEVKNIAKPVRAYRIAPPIATAASKPLALPDKPSIAVLPFTNMSGESEQEYFSDGISEDIITELSKLSALFVIARNSTFAYKGRSPDIRRVGSELGVRYVLEGSVRKAADRVRVSAQLIDASAGNHVWAERYDRDLEDIFAVQDDITRNVVRALQVTLGSMDRASASQQESTNVQAYDATLRARRLLIRFTRESTAQARKILEDVIAGNPESATAYIELSRAHFNPWSYQWTESEDALDQAIALARQAIALDDQLPRAHTFLGHHLLYKNEHSDAIAECERGIALDANNAYGYAMLADALNHVGRPDEEIGQLKKAMRLDPHAPATVVYHLAHAYFLSGMDLDALETIREAITLNPDFVFSQALLAILYSELERPDEATATAANLLRLSPHWSIDGYARRRPYKDTALLRREIEALRKAGLD